MTVRLDPNVQWHTISLYTPHDRGRNPTLVGDLAKLAIYFGADVADQLCCRLSVIGIIESNSAQALKYEGSTIEPTKAAFSHGCFCIFETLRDNTPCQQSDIHT